MDEKYHEMVDNRVRLNKGKESLEKPRQIPAPKRIMQSTEKLTSCAAANINNL